MQQDYAIIVAGGKGLRMGGDVPKQFLPVGGKPVLMRTLEAFHDFSADLQIIVVLPREHFRRNHQGALFSVGGTLHQGKKRYNGLAGAYIALDQPCHNGP